MLVRTPIPTRVVGTASREIFVSAIIVGIVVPTIIVGTAVPTINHCLNGILLEILCCAEAVTVRSHPKKYQVTF